MIKNDHLIDAALDNLNETVAILKKTLLIFRDRMEEDFDELLAWTHALTADEKQKLVELDLLDGELLEEES